MTVEWHGKGWRVTVISKGVKYRRQTDIANRGEAGRKEALKIEKQMKLEAAIEWQKTGGKAPDAVPTLNEAIVRYHTTQGITLGNQTNAADNLKYLTWCADELGREKPITEITDEDIQNLVNKRATHTVKGTGRAISAATVNRTIIAPMRQMMNWMEKKAKVRGMHSIDWSDLELREAGPRERVLSDDDLDAIRAAVVSEDDGHRDAFEFALLCGLRLENFTGLRWREVSFEPEQGAPNGMITVIQKGGKEHKIPLTIGMRELLEKMQAKGKRGTAVFTYVASRTGKNPNPKSNLETVKGERYPVTYWGFDSWFGRVTARAKVKNVRPHDLRKTCGSNVLNVTGNIVAAQKLLGHSTVEQTARAYAFLKTDVLLNAMELVALAESQKQNRPKIVPNAPNSDVAKTSRDVSN